LDAAHFRKRAARARELAQFGDDLRISQMLLDVAHEMDAEADAIDAEHPEEQRRSPRLCPTEPIGALLHLVTDDPVGRPVQIVNLSFGGAKLRGDVSHTPGTRVALQIPSHSLHLRGRINRVRGTEAALTFDAESSADPVLGRLLRSMPAARVKTIARTGKGRCRDPIAAERC
jgi:hypothetical protein